MNDFPSDFEQNLKALAPVSCDDLVPDTFYRAGWEACAAQPAMQSQHSPQRSRPLKAFSTGLACGVLCAVVLTGVQNFPQPEHADLVASSAAVSVSLAESMDLADNGLVEPSVPIPPESVGEWSGLFAGFSIWNSLQDAGSPSTRAPAERPLSPAAQRYWSSLVRTEPTSRADDGESSHVDSASDRIPLRSFPLTDAVFEEFL